MLWTHAQIEALINLYRQNPCLYQVKNPLYHNKHARNAALKQLQSSLRSIGLTNVTIQDIKNKFGNLRTNFMVQHKRYSRSIRSGSDEVARPTVWYFEQMRFLLEHTLPRVAVDSLYPSNNQPLCAQSTSSDKQPWDPPSTSTHRSSSPQNKVILCGFEESQVDDEGDEHAEKPTYNLQDSEEEITRHNSNIITDDVAALDSSMDRGSQGAGKKRKTAVSNYEQQGTPDDQQSAATPHKKLKGKKNNKRASPDAEDKFLRSVVNTLQKFKGAIVTEPEKRRGENEVFGEFVATSLEHIKNEDMALYIDCQEEISKIIWGARRKLLI